MTKRFIPLSALMALFMIPALGLAQDTPIQCNVNGELQTVTDRSQCVQFNDNDISRVRKLADEANVSASLKVLDLELLNALSIGGKYKFKSKDIGDGRYMRIDKYRMEADLKPGTLMDDLPLSFGLESQSEITFVQLFNQRSETYRVENILTIRDLPINTRKALELPEGTFVSFDARLNLIAAIGQTWPLAAGLLKARAGVNTLVGGEFRVQVNRLNAQNVRLRLIGHKQKSTGFGAKFGFNDFGVAKIINKQILRITDGDELFKLEKSKADDDIFMVDYTLNLADEKVAQAYNGVFREAQKLKASLKLVGDIRNNIDFKEMLIGNIKELDDRAQEQMAVVDDENVTIKRNFKGSNIANGTFSKFKFGLTVFKTKKNESFRMNRLTSVSNDGHEAQEYYIYPSWVEAKRSEPRFLLNLSEALLPFIDADSLDENVVRTSNAIFTSDEDFEPIAFKNLSFSLNLKDKIMKKREFRETQRHILTLMPSDSAADKLRDQLSESGYSKKSTKNVSIHLRFIFHSQALEMLMAAKFGEKGNQMLSLPAVVKHEFLRYAEEFGIRLPRNGQSRIGRRSSHPRNRHSQLDSMTRLLSHIFDGTTDNVTRLDEFAELRESRLFKKHGYGFFNYLLSKRVGDDPSAQALADLVYLHVTIQGKNRESIEFRYGNNPTRELSNVVEFIDYLLNNDSESVATWQDILKTFGEVRVIYGDDPGTPVY